MDLTEDWWVAPLSTPALGWGHQGAGPGTTLCSYRWHGRDLDLNSSSFRDPRIQLAYLPSEKWVISIPTPTNHCEALGTVNARQTQACLINALDRNLGVIWTPARLTWKDPKGKDTNWGPGDLWKRPGSDMGLLGPSSAKLISEASPHPLTPSYVGPKSIGETQECGRLRDASTPTHADLWALPT